ncbi:MAG: hypothetical protein II013_02160 [Lachnobacterium sp.]|nr:hypothetical protein [Lachnobacterium sp.]
MTVVAIACKDYEFMYRSYTAHKVNEKKADKIVELLNAAGYLLRDGEVWHKFNVSSYDNAGVYAECQKFTLGKKLKEIKS